MGTYWADQLLLFSPRVWKGTVAFARIDCQWKSLGISIAGVFTPLICYYGFLSSDREVASRNELSSFSLRNVMGEARLLLRWATQSPWFWAYSAWSIGCIWKGTTGIRMVAAKIWSWRTETQSPTRPEAWKTLSGRITVQKAVRKRRYDLYLPESNSSMENGILVLPGFGIEHVAYAGIASRFADAGYVVAVVSAEPLRVAWTEFGCDAVAVGRIQEQISKEYPSISSWTLIGHSMGSFTATHLAADLPHADHVLMWASAPMVSIMRDLSTTHIRVLVLQVANDHVIEMMLPDAATRETLSQKYYQLLPSDTVVRVIEGGTHAGFASYTSSNAPEKPGIPLEQQQALAVDWSLEFLRQASI